MKNYDKLYEIIFEDFKGFEMLGGNKLIINDNLEFVMNEILEEKDIELIFDMLNLGIEEVGGLRSLAKKYGFTYEWCRKRFKESLSRLTAPLVKEAILDGCFEKGSTPIETLKLSTRGYRVLTRHNIKTIEELIENHDFYSLCNLKTCGITVANEIAIKLQQKEIESNIKPNYGLKAYEGKTVSRALRRIMKNYNIDKETLTRYVEDL